jgi:hypothetical protein
MLGRSQIVLDYWVLVWIFVKIFSFKGDNVEKFLKYATDTGLHASVILPGACNAKCAFCYDTSKLENIGDYKAKLRATIATVPNDARKMAITGMEPTMSPYIFDALELVGDCKRAKRFDFVFLNSNGFRLGECANQINQSGVDAVNISRHAVGDGENAEIFKSASVPNAGKLERIISGLWAPVNINTVIPHTATEGEFEKRTVGMIDFAKGVGARSLTLRFQADNLLRKDELPAFLKKHETLQFGSNPGCRFYLKNINDFNVVAKYVTVEPTDYSNWNYGFIIQRDLRITRDWAGNRPHPMSIEKVI